MAHRYHSFDEAFTSWSNGYATATDTLLLVWPLTLSSNIYASHSQWKLAINDINSAIQLISNTINTIGDFNMGNADQSDFYESMYWASKEPAGGTVDMDAIINAMLAAEFDQLQHFIGIEDAYRVALWNAPFNADFYAGLARGFQKWP